MFYQCPRPLEIHNVHRRVKDLISPVVKKHLWAGVSHLYLTMERRFLLTLINIPVGLIHCGNHCSRIMVTMVKLQGNSTELSLGGQG